MTDQDINRAQLETDLARIEKAIADLQAILSGEPLEAALAPLRARQADLQARLAGPGAIAQGPGAKAVGAGGVLVEGNVGGDVVINPDPAARHLEQLRGRYLTRLAQGCNVLPLADLGGDDDTGNEVSLEDVYIALDTQTRVPLTKTEKKARRDDPFRQAEDRPLTALEAATQTPRLALLGDPGSGKSTFVRRLAAWLALAALDKRAAPAGWPANAWPMLTILRDLAPRLAGLELEGLSEEERRRRLVGAVWQQWQADLANLGAAELADSLEDKLAGGQVLLVFDGLDEVPERLRRRVRQAVGAVLAAYPAIKRIIVTCRIRSYTGAAVLPGFTSQTLALFDEAKIREFIAAWYRTQVKLGHLEAARAERNSQDLQQAALAAGLRELSSNPMLLTTMALIHQREVGLPRERVRLYSLAVQILLSRWQKRKGLAVSERLAAVLSDDRLLRLVLERLAYEAHRQQGARGPEADLSRRDILALLEEPAYLSDLGLAAEFLDYVDQRAGLLVGRGGDEDDKKPQTYNFPHRTFQEYLAGCSMVSGRGISREYCRRAEEGDYWSLAGQLGAEELYYNRRNDEALLDLAYDLCPAAQPERPADWRAILWSGQMASLIGQEAIERDTDSRDGGAAYFNRLLPRLVRILAETPLPPIERAEAGRVLAWLACPPNGRGDPRPGVGLRPDGLPDITWCEVPAGPFLMGEGKEQHTVTLPVYRLSKYPVTNAQYAAFVRDGGYTEKWRKCWTKAGWQEKGDRVEPYTYGGNFDLLNHPVVAVSWYEAAAFCNWLTLRLRQAGELGPNETMLLPSERQWEKAARGTDGRVYPWGNKADPNQANYDDTGINSTSAVGCFPSGVSPYGCEEMSGNVWEWCRTKWQDSYKDYRDDNDLEGDTHRVLRGGSWGSIDYSARCARRNFNSPRLRNDYVGFRVCVAPI